MATQQNICNLINYLTMLLTMLLTLFFHCEYFLEHFVPDTFTVTNSMFQDALTLLPMFTEGSVSFGNRHGEIVYCNSFSVPLIQG